MGLWVTHLAFRQPVRDKVISDILNMLIIPVHNDSFLHMSVRPSTGLLEANPPASHSGLKLAIQRG